MTMLPGSVQDSLRIHLDRVRAVHERDLKGAFDRVQLPDALARMRIASGRIPFYRDDWDDVATASKGQLVALAPTTSPFVFPCTV
jgi:hypothetical protein